MNADPSPSGVPSGDPRAETDRPRVMVVEDNAGDRWYFSELLRSRGYTVVSCEDGEQAWEAFQGAAPPLIMMDLMLPGMDGVELCRRIRAHPRGGHPVILAVSGMEDGEAISSMLSAGADDFLRKPVDAHLLDVRLLIAERRIREVQERHRTADALASKTRELETLFENLNDVFFSVDLRDGRLIQVSPSAERVVGHSTEALLRSSDLWRTALLGGEDPERAVEHLASVHDVSVHEFPIVRPDGTERWIRSNVRVERNQKGEPIRADGVAGDITEERRARVELARRNEELAVLYRLSEISLAAVSLEEAYQQILELAAGVLGAPIVGIEELDLDRDRLVLSASLGVGPSADGEAWEVPVHNSLSGRAVTEGQAVVVREGPDLHRAIPDALASDGIRFYAAFPLAAGGDVMGTLFLASPEELPWSDRRTALASTLATAVAAHGERLEAEEALRQSEARFRRLAGELQQANQELESFAYSVSHDLRAPLRTMQGFAHALVQNFGADLPPEARDYAQRIIASGKQSEGLISDLLAYSRLSFEELELKPVDLDAVVERAREQVQAYLDEAGAHLTVERNLPGVLGNHTALVQVLANLLSNAVKFVPPGRTPEVRIRHEDRGGDVRLWVEDNGVGIPEGQEERIFRVFERLTESGDRPGTGIGLAIVRRGMQRVNGDCGVERRPEGGSAFWIQVPKERRRNWRPWGRRA